MPSLSLNVGLNNGRKLPFGGAAPSGLPVASTASVVISNSVNGFFDGTYAKKIPSEMILQGYGEDAYMSAGVSYALVIDDIARVLLIPNSTIQNSNYGTMFGTPYANWVVLSFYWDNEAGNYVYFASYTNPSTNETTIPTTGWSPSITITAA